MITELREPQSRPAGHPARATSSFDIEADPRGLRNSLGRLSGLLRSLKPEPARKLRLLAAEILARSSYPRREQGNSIHLEISVLERAIRIEASGPRLALPSENRASQRERSFPDWVIEDITDRWGLDRQASQPTAWFEIALPAGG